MLLVSLFFISACQTPFQQITAEQLGEIQNLKTGQTLTPEQFIAQIANSKHLLVGEQHDNLKHHQAHFWLLEQLQKQRPQGSVLMEMLSVDQQPLIAKFSQNLPACDCLPEQLNWKKSWNWAFYGEIVKSVLARRIPLIATNLTDAEIQTLMTAAEPIKGYRSTEPQVQQQIAQLIISQHGFDNTSGENAETIRKMVQVQQFRDRRMAEKVANSPTPTLLIAGNHHIHKGYGVPIHLADLVPKLAVVSVWFGDDRQMATANDADYLWLFTK